VYTQLDSNCDWSCGSLPMPTIVSFPTSLGEPNAPAETDRKRAKWHVPNQRQVCGSCKAERLGCKRAGRFA
jgi:hypothetical protein